MRFKYLIFWLMAVSLPFCAYSSSQRNFCDFGMLYDAPSLTAKKLGPLCGNFQEAILYDKEIKIPAGHGTLKILQDAPAAKERYGNLSFDVHAGDILYFDNDEEEGYCTVHFKGNTYSGQNCDWLPGYANQRQDLYLMLSFPYPVAWRHIISTNGQPLGWYLFGWGGPNPNFKPLPQRK